MNAKEKMLIKFLLWSPQGNRPTGRPMHRWIIIFKGYVMHKCITNWTSRDSILQYTKKKELWSPNTGGSPLAYILCCATESSGMLQKWEALPFNTVFTQWYDCHSTKTQHIYLLNDGSQSVANVSPALSNSSPVTLFYTILLQIQV
jgi:hypothetical protein